MTFPFEEFRYRPWKFNPARASRLPVEAIFSSLSYCIQRGIATLQTQE